MLSTWQGSSARYVLPSAEWTLCLAILSKPAECHHHHCSLGVQLHFSGKVKWGSHSACLPSHVQFDGHDQSLLMSIDWQSKRACCHNRLSHKDSVQPKLCPAAKNPHSSHLDSKWVHCAPCLVVLVQPLGGSVHDDSLAVAYDLFHADCMAL